MALTEKLTSIADAIRAKTGGTAPLTLDGMATAIAGIETGGGSGGGTSGVYMAKVTPATSVGTMDIIHNLNTAEILFALCYVEDLGDIVPTTSTTIAKAWVNTDVLCRYGMTSYPGFNTTWKYDPSNSRAENMVITNGGHWDYVKDANTFTFSRGSSGFTYMAGLTYTVIIMAASAFSVTEV